MARGLEGVEGAESVFAVGPLLPNLVEASANAYWMGLNVKISMPFQASLLERYLFIRCKSCSTLKDGHCERLLPLHQLRAGRWSKWGVLWRIGWASLQCGTPMFGSRMELSSVEEALTRFGGGVIRPRGPGPIGKGGPTPESPVTHRPNVHLPHLLFASLRQWISSSELFVTGMVIKDAVAGLLE